MRFSLKLRHEMKFKKYKFDYNKLPAITSVLPFSALTQPPLPFLATQTVISAVNVPSQQSQRWVAVGGTRTAAVRHAG